MNSIGHADEDWARCGMTLRPHARSGRHREKQLVQYPLAAAIAGCSPGVPRRLRPRDAVVFNGPLLKERDAADILVLGADGIVLIEAKLGATDRVYQRAAEQLLRYAGHLRRKARTRGWLAELYESSYRKHERWASDHDCQWSFDDACTGPRSGYWARRLSTCLLGKRALLVIATDTLNADAARVAVASLTKAGWQAAAVMVSPGARQLAGRAEWIVPPRPPAESRSRRGVLL